MPLGGAVNWRCAVRQPERDIEKRYSLVGIGTAQHRSGMRMRCQLIGKIATIKPSTIDPCAGHIAGFGNQVGTVRVVLGRLT